MKPIRLMTLSPGHFHAALVQKRALPGVHRRVHVYSPLDADLIAHLDRVTAFNARPDDPTDWELDVRAGANFLDRFAREQPGNTVVLSGRNRPKIDLMLAAASHGLHVLADKPWVVEAADLPKLEQVQKEADVRDALVWDMLTERHEVTNRLMRELVREPDVFGDWRAGSPADPALVLESVHHLKKTVAGRPLRRPWWWFDPAVSGESIADVGTHLADLAMGLVAPDRPIDHRTDITFHDADRWPLVLSAGEFAEVTGLPGFPPELAGRVAEGNLYYAGNNTAVFSLRGVCVKLGTYWAYESPGGDTHAATACGTRATVSVHQEPGGPPEVSVSPADPGDRERLARVLDGCVRDWQRWFPGLVLTELVDSFGFQIPTPLRVGHEAHFAEVLNEFVGYVRAPRSVPAWEQPNALARYHVTTGAVALARQKRPNM